MFDSDINNVENMDNTKISQQSQFDHNLSNVIAGSETHWLSHLAGHRCSQIVHNFLRWNSSFYLNIVITAQEHLLFWSQQLMRYLFQGDKQSYHLGIWVIKRSWYMGKFVACRGKWYPSISHWTIMGCSWWSNVESASFNGKWSPRDFDGCSI